MNKGGFLSVWEALNEETSRLCRCTADVSGITITMTSHLRTYYFHNWTVFHIYRSKYDASAPDVEQTINIISPRIKKGWIPGCQRDAPGGCLQCSPQSRAHAGATGASALKREGSGDPFLRPIIISQARGPLQTLIPDSASNMTYRSETGTLQEHCTCFFMLFNLIHSLVGITSGCAL